MLELYTKYKLLIKIVFCNDQSFVGCLDKACSEIANYKPAESKSPSRSPELVSISVKCNRNKSNDYKIICFYIADTNTIF